MEAFWVVPHGKQERKIENNIRLDCLRVRELERSTEASDQYQALVFAAVKLPILLSGKIHLLKYEIKAITKEGICNSILRICAQFYENLEFISYSCSSTQTLKDKNKERKLRLTWP